MTTERRLDTIDHHLKSITEEIDRPTESTIAFRVDLAEIKETARAVSSQQQAESVARLSHLVEQLVESKRGDRSMSPLITSALPSSLKSLKGEPLCYFQADLILQQSRLGRSKRSYPGLTQNEPKTAPNPRYVDRVDSLDEGKKRGQVMFEATHGFGKGGIPLFNHSGWSEL